MSKNKTTMRDIANACNVSLATVSYVINNSEKEKIKHETRIKVLEAARRLNYMPPTGKPITHQKSNLVGVIINWNHSSTTSKRMLYYDLAIELQLQLSSLGYDTIVATTKSLEEDADIIAKRSLDAVFIIDMNSEKLHQVTTKYYVPILFLDCEINDEIFYKIYPNYSVILTEAKRMLGDQHPFLVMEDILNEELKALITMGFPKEDIFIHTIDNHLQKFLFTHQEHSGIVLGEFLGLEVERYHKKENLVVLTMMENSNLLSDDIKTITLTNRTKAKAAVNIMDRLLHLQYDCCPGNRLLLNPSNEVTM